MTGQIIAAVIGTIAFSVVFIVPAKYYLYCGLIGGAGWAVLSLSMNSLGEGLSTMLAAMTVLFLSRLTAVIKRCPATIFLVAGILPLVPGVGVYKTAYYAAAGELGRAAATGYIALKDSIAIVLGIALVFEIPQKLFNGIGRPLTKRVEDHD